MRLDVPRVRTRSRRCSRLERLTTEHDEEVTAVQQTVERLTTDLEAANRDREGLAGKVKNLTDRRDDLLQQLTALQPKSQVPPPRPGGPARYQPAQHHPRSRSTRAALEEAARRVGYRLLTIVAYRDDCP